MGHLEIYKDDINSIRNVIREKTQVTVTPEEACEIWESYSKTKAAGWVFLPKTKEEIWQELNKVDLTNYIGWTAAELKYGV
jgi:hypothetical protein